MNLIDFCRGIQNEKQFVMNMIGQNQNPMIGQLMNLAKTGDSKQIESFARNICKERSIDFDKEFADFMKQIKG